MLNSSRPNNYVESEVQSRYQNVGTHLTEGETYAIIDKSKKTVSHANCTVTDDTVMWENDDLYDATGGQTDTEINKCDDSNSNTLTKDHRNLDSGPEEETVMEENDDLYNQP